MKQLLPFPLPKHTLTLIYLIALTLVACEEPSSTDNATNTAPTNREDTMASPSSESEKRAYNPYYNHIGRFIAGLPPKPGSMLDSLLLNSPDWNKYALSAERNWKKLDSIRLTVIHSWATQELKAIHDKKELLFYPFSGPDMLYAHTFFPTSKTYVLIGLEPVGESPVFNADSIDSLARYISSINKSLYAILNFSFFRTLSMKADLSSREINGVTPLLMIFLERTKNTILDVRYINLDAKGQVAYETDPEIIKHKGVEITFSPENDPKDIRQLYYFSLDLSDNGLKKAPEFTAYINNLGQFTTYLKSASYLMHENYFSSIRSTILDRSNNLLQDDSGIPYRFFAPDKWQTTLYGTYTGVINLFANKHQKELIAAYRDSTHNKVKPLPFGIGYKYKPRESNLMLAQRKQK